MKWLRRKPKAPSTAEELKARQEEQKEREASVMALSMFRDMVGRRQTQR